MMEKNKMAGIASLVGLLLVVVIFIFLVYLMMEKKEGPTASKGILDSTKKRIEAIKKQTADRVNQ